MQPRFVLSTPPFLCLSLSLLENQCLAAFPSFSRAPIGCLWPRRKKKKDRYRFLEALPWRCFRRTSIYRCSKRVLEWPPLMASIDWANRTWQAQKYHYRLVSLWPAALRHDAERDRQALHHCFFFSQLPPSSFTRCPCSRCGVLVGASGCDRSVVARPSPSPRGLERFDIVSDVVGPGRHRRRRRRCGWPLRSRSASRRSVHSRLR